MNELVFVLTPVIVSFVFAYLSSTINKENVALKLLFMIGSLAFIIISSSMTITLAQVGNGTATYNEVYEMSQTSYMGAIFLFITFIAIVILIYLSAIFKSGTTTKWDRIKHEEL